MNGLAKAMDEYVLAIVDDRYEDAKRHLIDAIIFARQESSLPVLAGQAQRLGSVLLKQGDRLAAEALYELSEGIDSKSLFPKLVHAKFLARELGDPAKAINKCNEIISSAISNPNQGDVDDDEFSCSEYQEAAEGLLAEIASAHISGS